MKNARAFWLPIALVLMGLAPLSAVADSTTPATSRVLCADAIGGSSEPLSQDATLGRVRLATYGDGTLQAVRLSGDRFQWWAKVGLEVGKDATPVTLSIPVSWRSRAAIGWNNRGGDEASVQRVSACPGTGWLAYPGGLHLTSKGCVPLDVRVANRHERIWIAVGSRARCPSR